MHTTTSDRAPYAVNQSTVKRVAIMDGKPQRAYMHGCKADSVKCVLKVVVPLEKIRAHSGHSC
jgi:hypothetical protein